MIPAPLPDLMQLLADPVVAELAQARENTWFRDSSIPAPEALEACGIDPAIVEDADSRFQRFAPWFVERFPQTRPMGGILESPLQPAPKLHEQLDLLLGEQLPGRVLVKRDDALPVSGSIKARGGIHEVLQVAEAIATAEGLLSSGSRAQDLMSNKARTCFSGHRIAVGSTGNLALAIGVVATELGFGTTVHMSTEARAWKKELLRSRGAEVVEHGGSFSDAVAAGRASASGDERTHFIDDEDSLSLFAGYAVAGRRLAAQLASLQLAVDESHPLFVYLPCGVGGGPGGITFGLKLLFGDAVHCIFAEPTHAPAMSLGVRTRKFDNISITDIGLDGSTVADGLAVGRPSRFVASRMANLIDGFATVSDAKMQAAVPLLHETEGVTVEPSATAGFTLPWRVLKAEEYRATFGLDDDKMGNATHLLWCTGGGLVPGLEQATYLSQGRTLLQRPDTWATW